MNKSVPGALLLLILVGCGSGAKTPAASGGTVSGGPPQSLRGDYVEINGQRLSLRDGKKGGDPSQFTVPDELRQPEAHYGATGATAAITKQDYLSTQGLNLEKVPDLGRGRYQGAAQIIDGISPNHTGSAGLNVDFAHKTVAGRLNSPPPYNDGVDGLNFAGKINGPGFNARQYNGPVSGGDAAGLAGASPGAQEVYGVFGGRK